MLAENCDCGVHFSFKHFILVECKNLKRVNLRRDGRSETTPSEPKEIPDLSGFKVQEEFQDFVKSVVVASSFNFCFTGWGM